jgi:hypothetical protein
MRNALALVVGLALAPGAAPAAIHTFDVASIDGAQETPPNASTSTGSATLTLDDSTGIATFNITHNCCDSGEILAHVHGPAAPGVPAGIVYSLPLGSPKVGSSPALTPQQQADMLAGLHYVNIHSNDFVGGEIRGQITLTGTTQLKPTKSLLVKNPPAGPTKRRIVWKVREAASSNTVTGNPNLVTSGGATLRVALTPGGDQCFTLPTGNWTPIGTVGFKYKDTDLSEGAVKVLIIKKAGNGTFLIRAVIKAGGTQPVNVTPGNPTASYALNLKIGDGDAYCSATDIAAPQVNSATTFKVKNDGTPAVCPLAACSPSGAFVEATVPLF